MFIKKSLTHLVMITFFCVVTPAAQAKTAPIITPETPYQLDIKQWQHASGANVLFIEADELPMLDIRIVYSAGSARDGDLPGLAAVTNALLEEGTAKYSANEIAEQFEQMGAQFYAKSQRDMAVVHLRTLSEKDYLLPTIELLSHVIGQPAFSSDALRRIKKQALAALQQEKEEPGAILSNTLYETLYHQHPYAHSPLGTETSIKKIAQQNIQDFFKQYYVGNNMTIAIVGDTTQDVLEPLIDTLLQYVSSGSKPKPLPAPTSLTKDTHIHITHPSSQTHVAVATVGVNYHDSLFFPLYLGNHVLGGGLLTSILSIEIREKRGLTYGASSYFAPMQQKGPFVIQFQTRNEKAGEALEVTQNILSEYLEQGPTQEQLSHARDHLLGSFALRTASNRALVNQLAMMGFYHLPENYLAKFYAGISSADQKLVTKALHQSLYKKHFLTITVGQKS